MADFHIEIKGLDELVRDAGKAGKEMEDRLYETMVAATTWIKNDARRIGPGTFKNQTGNLRGRAIHRRVISARKGIVAVDAEYGRYVEFGTRPHIILPKNRKFLAFKSAGRLVFAKKVNHPGTRPYNYMKNAFEKNLKKITDTYADVAETITKVLAGKK